MTPTLLTSPPGRRLGNQVLILNQEGKVLLKVVEYRSGFLLPGGSAEKDELPHLAASRHVEVGTGLVLRLREILAVDYVDTQLLPEGINFVYLGGVLDAEQETAVAAHQPPDEIRALQWVHPDRLGGVMQADQHRRVEQALDAMRQGRRLPMLLRGHPAN
ncbi:NUDIX domain-containing protein [Kitasatospora sp. NPDC001574]